MPAALVSLADMELTDSAQGSNPWQRRDAFGQADVAFDPLRELLARGGIRDARARVRSELRTVILYQFS
jgi:hypothetical protein